MILFFYVCGLATISLYLNYIIQMKGDYFKKQKMDCADLLYFIGGINSVITDPVIFCRMNLIIWSQMILIIKVRYLRKKEENKLKNSLKKIKIGIKLIQYTDNKSILTHNLFILSKNCAIYEKSLKYIEQEFGFKSECLPLLPEDVALISYVSSMGKVGHQDLKF